MHKTQPKRAAALGYQPERDPAPRLLSKGERHTAERMIELARAAGVPIVENAALAASLTQLDEGVLIPAELYQAVAEVLAFVYRLDERYAERGSHQQKGGAV